MATFASDFWAKFWEGTDGKVRFCWGFVVDIYPPANDHISHLGQFGKTPTRKRLKNRGFWDSSQENNLDIFW